jgi:hypothetical protein
MVGATARHRLQTAPGLDVRGDTRTGDAVELVAKLAADASLLVLGASGRASAAGRVRLPAPSPSAGGPQPRR